MKRLFCCLFLFFVLLFTGCTKSVETMTIVDEPIIEEPEIVEEEPKSFDLTMTFTGDVLIASEKNYTSSGSFNEYAENNPPTYFLEKVAPIFEKDDFTIVNLENVLSDNDLQEIEKELPAFWFYAKTANTDILTSSSVEVVSLANNHYGDYGLQGKLDTEAAVEAAGLLYGKDDKTVYLEKNGYTIALICNGLWGEWQADSIVKRIEEAEAQSDFQVVYFHGGKEGIYTPEDWKIRAVHKIIDGGADLVIGNHPHVLQRWEEYNGVDIIYSMGNFCFGGNRRPKNRTIIYTYTLTISPEGVLEAKKGEIIPCYVYTGDYNNYQPMVIEEEEVKQQVLDFMHGNADSPM